MSPPRAIPDLISDVLPYRTRPPRYLIESVIAGLVELLTFLFVFPVGFLAVSSAGDE
jgi:hypothetical protein